MKVLILTQFSKQGGSSRIQVLQFLPLLIGAGIQYSAYHLNSDRFYRIQMGIVVVPRWIKKVNLCVNIFLALFKRVYYAFLALGYDAVLIQKDTFPKFVFWAMRRMNPRIIYELDDTIYEMNPFLRQSFLYEILLRYQAGLCVNMMAKSAWVIAENEYLAEEARRHNKNVSILSAPIDIDRFRPAPLKKSMGIMIGWIGSPSTTHLLLSLAPVWQEIGRRYPQAEFKVVGAASYFTVSGIRFVKKEWRVEDEPADLHSFDIGLMPLDDAPFNRGRLGYKMVQYMSVGIPVVASDIGLNRSVVKDGVNGFLVSTTEQWVEKLGVLIRDGYMRDRMGKEGRKIVEDRFSLEKTSKVLITVLGNVVAMKT